MTFNQQTCFINKSMAKYSRYCALKSPLNLTQKNKIKINKSYVGHQFTNQNWTSECLSSKCTCVTYVHLHKLIYTLVRISYKCDVCSASYKISRSLKEHSRIHSGEKPYKCEICSATFSQANSLKTHLRIHSGERPYKCEVCSATFTRSSHLKTHSSIHSLEKPIQVWSMFGYIHPVK